MPIRLFLSWDGSSSHSSSFGSGGSKSFSSSSGKSYSSGSLWHDDNRRGYGTAKSYTSSAGHIFGSFGPNPPPLSTTRRPSSHPAEPDSSSSHFNFDDAAARARKEQASKQ